MKNPKFKKGDKVYYVKKSYGVHTVVKFNQYDREYLLDLDGQMFWSPEARVKSIEK